MKTLLVVYHSATGGARQMAEAAAEAGGAETGTRVLLQPAMETLPEHVLRADGYVFAMPEHLGAMSGMMKDFFDRCYYPALDGTSGRPYAALICAGSDGSNAARQLERIVKGWRLKAVAAPLIICTKAQTPEAIAAPKIIAAEDLARCGEIGASLAAGLAIGIF